MDRKAWIILILSIVCAVLLYLQISAPVIIDRSGSDQRKLDSLALANQRLNNAYISVQKHLDEMKAKHDSLLNLETKIKIEYRTKYEKLDRLTAGGLVDEFNRILAGPHDSQ
jgi:hypothetical protein